ncbi:MULTISPECIES: serine/threonine-protein kinase [Catenuloplanes]|uniref:serine/threonine-protein kinase n=1 Tax=Catenuloplanes TaxID=33874 RepID=UPI00286B866E|nr:protein kinase [Catenuloplanes niger]
MTQIPTWNSPSVGPTGGRAVPGATIGGRYSLRTAVGHGGMGTVWRASDTLLRRDVAVKEVVLPPGLAPSDRDQMYERTLREARAAAALQHPAVVQVYDVVHEGGRPWIVMELLDARSLADMIIEDGPLAPRAVAKIGIALLGALEVAHAAGVLHRDVKPANVLIAADGRCVLTDFGVARMPTDVQLTTPGMVLGSPHFISPERAMGQDFGPPSDLFSLGVTLFTAVEGRPPFDKGDPIETMHSVVEDPPLQPVRAGSLANVLLGLLEKDPARRMDVTTARRLLRELLSGPLASNVPPHLATDPYAVVPAQRPRQNPNAPMSPAPPQAPPKPPPSGAIGGPAMLAPGESLTDRLRAIQSGEQSGGASPVSPAAYGGMPAGPPPMGAPWQPHNDTTAPIPPHVSYPSHPGMAPTGAMPSMSQSGGVYGGGGGGSSRGTGGGALDSAKRLGSQAVGTVRSWPRRTQAIAAAGTAAALILVVVLFNLGGGTEEPTPTPIAGNETTTSEPATPTIPVEQYANRGISVDVPAGWRVDDAEQRVYVDFTDPEDKGRRLRITVENGGDLDRFVTAAENFLADNPTSCPKPYTQVQRNPAEMSGVEAIELEYTCGQGDAGRHGIRRFVASGGKVYSFFLTTTEARFQESKPIYDQTVQTFTLTAS